MATFVYLGRKRLHDGFLKVDLVTYDYTKRDGAAQPKLMREIMQRPDSAGVLLYLQSEDKIVLTRQLRIGLWDPLAPKLVDPFLLEIPAGSVEPKPSETLGRPETTEECAQREAVEETGFKPALPLQEITTILPSPGGTSERIHIFYAVVSRTDEIGKGGGVGDEDIERVEMPVEELFRLMDAGKIADAKLVVAAQWFRQNRWRRKDQSNPTLQKGAIRYLLKEDVENHSAGSNRNTRVIGIRTGPIAEAHGYDVWLNAENTDMQMARYFDPGLSGTIRFLGAARQRTGLIHSDTIADDLKRRLAGEVVVRPGRVVVTTSGDLRYTHGVKCIMHVACAQHSPGGQTVVQPADAATGLSRALNEAEHRNEYSWRRWFRPTLRSMIVPLIGAGNGGADPARIAAAMVPVAQRHLMDNPATQMREVYFLAYKQRDLDIITGELKSLIDAGILVSEDEAKAMMARAAATKGTGPAKGADTAKEAEPAKGAEPAKAADPAVGDPAVAPAARA